jgi:hypothetical protein
LVLIYNDYVAAYTFQGIVLFLKQILIDLLPESSINDVTQKTYIAQSVLQWWEFMLVVIGFVAMIFYVIIILLEHLIRALRIQKWHIIAFDFTIIVYGLMALLPLTMRGIGPDLFLASMDTFHSIIYITYDINLSRRNILSFKKL